MAAIVLGETFLLIVYRTVMTYQYNHYTNDSTFGKANMHRIEGTVRILLAVHTVLNVILLFS